MLNRRTSHLNLRWEQAVLVGIVAAGMALRLYGLAWGYPVHLHCDENTTIAIALDLGRQFQETGCLRPRASHYGALPMYLLLLGLAPTLGVSRLLGLGTDVGVLSLGVGRAISALADSGTILVVYLIGARAFGKTGGLIAAACYATALLPMREAQFFTVDPLATLMLAIFLLLCMRLSAAPTVKNFIFCGVGLGLAFSAKTSALPLLPLPVLIWLAALKPSLHISPASHRRTVAKMRVAAVGLIVLGLLPLLVWGQFRGEARRFAESRLLGPHPQSSFAAEHAPVFWEAKIAQTLDAADGATHGAAALLGGLGVVILIVTLTPRGRQWAAEAWQQKGGIIGCFGVAVAVFLVINPHAVLSPTHYWLPTDTLKLTWNALNASGAYRAAPFAWTFQFVDTTPYLYQLRHIYPYALGMPLMIVALAAVVYWCGQLLGRQAGPAWPLVVAMLLMLGSMGGMWMKMTRYVLPQIPVLCLLAGGMLGAFDNTRMRYQRWLGAAVVALVLLSTGAWSLAYLNIYRHPDNRLAAFDYVDAVAPPGSNILIEEDDAWGITGLNLWHSLNGRNVHIYDPHYIEHDYYGQPIPATQLAAKREYLQEHLQWADYLVLTELRRERIRHLGAHFPVISRFYEHLFGEQSDWRLLAEYNTGPALFGIPIDDSGSEPTFRLFDHPHVYVFSKRIDRTQRIEQ